MTSPSNAAPSSNGASAAHQPENSQPQSVGEAMRDFAHQGVDGAFNVASHAIDTGTKLFERASASLREIGKTAVDAVLNFPLSMPPKMEEWAKMVDTGTETFSEAVFNYFLKFADTLGLDSSPRATFGAELQEFVFSLMPFLGPSKEIGVARAHYRQACEENDAHLKQVARRECLYACGNLGLDTAGVAALGLSGSATKLAKLFAGLTLLRVVAFATYSDDSHLGRAADKLLAIPLFGVIIDQLLTADPSTAKNAAKPVAVSA